MFIVFELKLIINQYVQHLLSLHWQYLRLYMWRDESNTATRYKAFLLINNAPMLSFTIKQSNKSQKLHKAYFTKFDCVVFVDLRIAKKEIVKKR